jgi:hypothetical protein
LEVVAVRPQNVDGVAALFQFGNEETRNGARLQIEEAFDDPVALRRRVERKENADGALRDAKDAPLEGLGWIHGFIPSSPLLFKHTVRRPELRKIVPSANTTM